MKLLRQTGRKDRRGTPIREGDILLYYRDGNEKSYNSKVVRWRETARATGFNIGNCNNYQITGNVYEKI